MSVKYYLIKDGQTERICTCYEEQSVIPNKGDELVLVDRDNNYKETSYKVIKRTIEYMFSVKEMDTKPYEVIIYLKEVKHDKNN